MYNPNDNPGENLFAHMYRTGLANASSSSSTSSFWRPPSTMSPSFTAHTSTHASTPTHPYVHMPHHNAYMNQATFDTESVATAPRISLPFSIYFNIIKFI